MPDIEVWRRWASGGQVTDPVAAPALVLVPDPEPEPDPPTPALIFVDANRRPGSQLFYSPSRAVRLEVFTYVASDGSEHTEGELRHCAQIIPANRQYPNEDMIGARIAIIQRNHPHFPVSWAATRSNERGRGETPDTEWFIGGTAPAEQTIVNLRTGKVYQSTGTADGFCWLSATLLQDGQTLAVEGCYWGSQPEFQFFNFAPERGWSRLPCDRPLPQSGHTLLYEPQRDTIVWEDQERVYTRTKETEAQVRQRLLAEQDGPSWMRSSVDFGIGGQWDLRPRERLLIRRRDNRMLVEAEWAREAG